NGKSITKAFLAKLLSQFLIYPKQIRIAEATSKGYERSMFYRAWSAHIPGFSPPPSNPGKGETGGNTETLSLDDKIRLSQERQAKRLVEIAEMQRKLKEWPSASPEVRP